MTRSLSPEFYSVLIEGNLNNFTVMELRDAIIREYKHETDMNLRDYHKRAYRVVLRLLTAGLLEKSKDISEFARYNAYSGQTGQRFWLKLDTVSG